MLFANMYILRYKYSFQRTLPKENVYDSLKSFFFLLVKDSPCFFAHLTTSYIFKNHRKNVSFSKKLIRYNLLRQSNQPRLEFKNFEKWKILSSFFSTIIHVLQCQEFSSDTKRKNRRIFGKV